MPIYLRQSTTSQEVPLGYFVDSTDGNTEETGLTIANTDIKIWKTGATTLANKNSGGGTHISNGVYYATLDDTDTNTIGPLVIFVHVSGALAVRLECCVLDEAVYDVWFGTATPTTGGAITVTSGRVNADVTHISGDSGAADNLEAACDGTGYNVGAGSVVAASVTGAVGSVTGAVGSVTGNVGGNVTGSVGSLATQAKADVNTECDTAISDAALATAANLSTVSTNVSTVLSRLGSITGSGVNTVLGFFKALLSKTATTPSDIGGTFDPAADSTEAIRDRGDAAWVTGGSSSDCGFSGFVTKSGSTYYVSFICRQSGAVVAGASLSSLVVGFYDEDGTDLTFSGTPAAASSGIVYASGTLGTSITDNRPVMVKVGATIGGTAYSDYLAGANIA